MGPKQPSKFLDLSQKMWYLMNPEITCQNKQTLNAIDVKEGLRGHLKEPPNGAKNEKQKIFHRGWLRPEIGWFSLSSASLGHKETDRRPAGVRFGPL